MATAVAMVAFVVVVVVVVVVVAVAVSQRASALLPWPARTAYPAIKLAIWLLI